MVIEDLRSHFAWCGCDRFDYNSYIRSGEVEVKNCDSNIEMVKVACKEREEI